MTLTYSLSQQDYLQYFLFVESKKQKANKKRTNNWIISSVSLFLLSYMFYTSSNIFLTYNFLIFGIVFACFFPMYNKRYIKTYYTDFVFETYKNRGRLSATINVTDSHIEVNDTIGESKIYLAEIENIIETGQYFYIKMKIIGHIIIPKPGLTNISFVQDELQGLCKKLGIKYVEDLTWKWK